MGDVTLREGDRVLQQRNDYTKEVFNGDLGTVVAVDGDGSVRVVFGAAATGAADDDETSDAASTSTTSEKKRAASGKSGETAEAGPTPTSLDPIARALKSLDGGGGREVSYSRAECRDLLPAWALTVHKAQGSEYAVVVMPLLTGHGYMLYRNLMYTGFSRAKSLLVLVGEWKALGNAVAYIGPANRRTLLHERISVDDFAPTSCSRAWPASLAKEPQRRVGRRSSSSELRAPLPSPPAVAYIDLRFGRAPCCDLARASPTGASGIFWWSPLGVSELIRREAISLTLRRAGGERDIRSKGRRAHAWRHVEHGT